MKILYAIQGTGNGHLSRAMEIIPHLRKKGELDLLISGTASDLPLPFNVKYRLHGWSYMFGRKGGINLFRTLKNTKLLKLFCEIRDLPVHEYDLVISDFEPVSSWACILKGKKCIGLSNQAAITKKLLPGPRKFDLIGRLILQFYAPCSAYYGFHFENLGPGFYLPVIRKAIRDLKPESNGHYTVYLPAHSDGKILHFLRNFKGHRFEVFSKHNRIPLDYGRISIQPIHHESFVKSLANCDGVICAAGFATASEALFLKKKLLVVPMKNQLEQHYNAAVLEKMGVAVLQDLSGFQTNKVKNWLLKGEVVSVNYRDQTAEMIDHIVTTEAIVEDAYVHYLTKEQYNCLAS